MTKALNAWAIWHPSQGLLVHSIHPNQRGAWAMFNMHRQPEEKIQSAEELMALGFIPVQVRVKYEEPHLR